MIQHVWERTRLAKLPQRILIATDDERIADTARGFGAEVVITRHDHVSGTDRVAEAAATTDAEIIVNIQGDEPLIDPDAIDAAISILLDDPECQMATLKKRIVERDEIDNPNVVKVVTGHDGRALYFSRHPIPYDRGDSAEYWKHIGLYVYRRALLLGYSTLRPGVLEQNEKLEQLRALENGISIRVAETRYETVGVDTPEDLLHVESLLITASIPTTNHG